MKIVILGQVPAKKNSRNLFVRNGRIINIPSKIYKVWEDDALIQLKAYKGQAKNKVTVAYEFYVKDLRRRDIDNMIASVNDVLVKSGLLVDDDWQHLAIGAGDVELNKDNPRVELYLEED